MKSMAEYHSPASLTTSSCCEPNGHELLHISRPSPRSCIIAPFPKMFRKAPGRLQKSSTGDHCPCFYITSIPAISPSRASLLQSPAQISSPSNVAQRHHSTVRTSRALIWITRRLLATSGCHLWRSRVSRMSMSLRLENTSWLSCIVSTTDPWGMKSIIPMSI